MKPPLHLLSALATNFVCASFSQAAANDPLGLQNGVLTYRAAPGAINTVTVVLQNGRIVLTDSTSPLPPCAPIPGMQRPNPNTLSLPAASVQSLNVDLGDRDDHFNAAGLPKPLNIVGGDGSDFIRGGSANDIIVGGTGIDVINGDAGDDQLHGDDDSDTIAGGLGNDTLTGDAGDDELHGNDGDDTIAGGLGNDTITGDAGDDELQGDDGDDTIAGGLGDDTLFGAAGNDSLSGDEDNDTLQGDDGDDTLRGEGGVDEICGGNGNDSLHGERRDSGLYGRDASGLMGTDGNDIFHITRNPICGGADDDQLFPPMNGGQGHDIVSFHDFHFSAEKEAALAQTLQSLSIEELEFENP